MLVVSGALIYGCGDRPSIPGDVTHIASPADTAGISPRGCPEYISHTVKPRQTLAGILDRFGFAPLEVNRIYRTLVDNGLTKIYPGDSLVLAFNDSCVPFQLSLLSRMQHWYTAAWRDTTIVVEKHPLAVIESRCLVNGVLETSLLEAMQNAGLGPYLACKLSDIFAWDINFFLDPRKGDTFQILFVQKYAENRLVGYGDVLAARYTCNGKDFYAIGFSDASNIVQYYDRSGKSVQKEFLKAPLRFSRISSGFSYHRKHPILGIVRPHFGIDYAAPAGTPVYAAAEGKIMSAGWNGNYGKMVAISHGGSYATYYGHLASIASGIHGGAYVRQGQMIGTVGATGLATGPHLDYRMKRNGNPVNPLTVVLPSKSGIGDEDREAFNRVNASFCALMDHRCANTYGYYMLDVKSSAAVGDSIPPASLTSSASPAHVIRPGS
jgi:murein DD-endopeptidase MepM/ murein hydrolase activator NlpD